MSKLLYKSPNRIWEISESDNGNLIVENLKDGFKEILHWSSQLRQSYLVPQYVKDRLKIIEKQRRRDFTKIQVKLRRDIKKERSEYTQRHFENNTQSWYD